MKKPLLVLLAAALSMPAAFAQNDVQAAAQKALGGSAFKDVHVSVQNSVATLNGNVDLVAAKLKAEQKVRHVKGVSAIRDEIQVNGPDIPDQQLQQKLLQDITNEIWGYFPVQFQTISVAVHNGVAYIGGHAAGPIAASDALAVVENTKGVKDVVDNLQVDPVSPMDQQIRWAEFRAIYGYPIFEPYLINPNKPIRIQVENGHVTLLGVVDTQQEKQVAGIRANSVPNVFSVTNDLQVAHPSQEKPSGK